MKKINVFFVSGVIFTLLFTTRLNAQQPESISSATTKTKQLTDMAVIGDTPGVNDNSSKATAKEMKAKLNAAKISTKVNNHIAAHFKNVSGLQIINSEQGTMVAKFAMSGKVARVLYDAKGNWVYTIINCTENDLPENVKQLVYASYKGFTITLVQELSQGTITCYKIFLEDCRNLKEIFVYNDEITVDKEFVK